MHTFICSVDSDYVEDLQIVYSCLEFCVYSDVIFVNYTISGFCLLVVVFECIGRV